jgi:hypothetical protein
VVRGLETMGDDDPLDRHVRELLRSGKLPRHGPERLWGGFGSGQERCIICGELVSAGQVSVEAEFRNGGAPRNHEFHAGCFWAVQAHWERLDD